METSLTASQPCGRLLKIGYHFDRNALFEEKGRLVCVAWGRSGSHTPELLPDAPAFPLVTTSMHWHLITLKAEMRLLMPCTTTEWRESFSNCSMAAIGFKRPSATPFINRLLTLTNSYSKCRGMIDISSGTCSDYWC